MLIQADAAQLEVRVAAYLSQDKVMMDEILSAKDMHTDNQTRFRLTSRGMAKIWIFRILYGGSAYSFAHDPNFKECGYSEKEWETIIKGFYDKYPDVREWHSSLIRQATTTGKIIMPTGRVYNFKPELKKGELIWPQTTIKNYPVQGLGADLMALARVSLYHRLKSYPTDEVKMVNTVHDSIILDAKEKYVDELAQVLKKVFQDIPANFEKMFHVPFNVPMDAEVQVGTNWKKMEKIC